MKTCYSLLLILIWLNAHPVAGVTKNMDMSGMDHSGMVHDHMPREIPANAAIPAISLQLYRDAKDGFNLHLQLANFNIAAPEFDKPIGQLLSGHAHLYINGEKIQRLYGRYNHLPSNLFKPGVNVVMVSLNAHNHDVWTYNAQQIMASIAIKPALDNFAIAQFSSSPTAN